MKKKPRSHSEFPIGTLAAYGPDAQTANKLVASIFHRAGQKEPTEMQRWFVNGGDIRQVPSIQGEVSEFFKQHEVKQMSAAEIIMGCAHQEGIDYPMGRECPRCPFWHGIDRFTHEPIVPPTPTRSPEQILAELSAVSDRQPTAALESADTHREVLVKPLLQAIEKGLTDPTGLTESEAMLFNYATYLLAKWRETRAYPYLIRWLSLPGEEAFDLGGDTVTDDGCRMLASVFDGDFEPIKQLILNREANEYCRGQAVQSLSMLAIWAEVPSAMVEEYFLWLAREGLEREYSHVWENLASACADMEALAVFPELRRAYADKLISPGFMSQSKLDEIEAGPRGNWIKEQREWHPPITDVVAATGWWQCFNNDLEIKKRRAEFLEDYANEQGPTTIDQPYVAPTKTGRNDPCPCGSGKKYKKCCGK